MSCVAEDLRRVVRGASGSAGSSANGDASGGMSSDQSDAMEFIESTGYDVNWIIDDGSIAALYPTSGIPYTLVLDESGSISTIFNGSAADMFRYFEQAVKAADAGN